MSEVRADPRFATLLRVGFFAFLGFLIVTGVTLPALHHWMTREAPHPLERLVRVPEFTLTERSGQPISRDDLLGRVWIADFMFTRCANVCITMSKQLGRIQRTIERFAPSEQQRLRLVSFTLDPEWDTPERLTDYAQAYGASPDIWYFVTGDRERIMALMEGGFLLPGATSETPSGPIIHSSKFALVDAEGWVRGFYEGIDRDAVMPLLEDARRLLRERQ